MLGLNMGEVYVKIVKNFHLSIESICQKFKTITLTSQLIKEDIK